MNAKKYDKNQINRLLLVALTVLILITGWWFWNNKKTCDSSTLEDCDGKEVNITGIAISSKTYFLCDIENRIVKYTWLANCIMISNDEIMNKTFHNKNVNVVGVIKASNGEVCGGNADRIEQCGGKYYPTEIQIGQIRVLENQTT